MNKLLSVILFLVLFSTTVSSQTISVADFTTQDIFIERKVTGINWMNDGKFYTVLQDNRIVKYDVTTGKPVQTLVDGGRFESPVVIDDYSLSGDEEKILLQTQTRSIYRRSFVAEYFLFDVNSQTLVNMKETGSVKFDPRSSRRFRIYFGENLKISPEAVHLGRAYPNPASGLTTIAFSLPETGGLGQSVTLDIVDAMGHVVGTIQQGRYDPGFHQAAVDVSEITKGFYTYRLSVQNHNGRTIEVNKLIIK